MTDITVSRKKQERRYVFCIVAMIAVCLAVAVMELSMGALSIDPIESVLALFGIGSAQDVNTVQSIRLPRTVCAIVSGAGLALAGAALQSVLENPLASASTVGISQGAAFGATVAILIIVPTVFGSSQYSGVFHFKINFLHLFVSPHKITNLLCLLFYHYSVLIPIVFSNRNINFS